MKKALLLLLLSSVISYGSMKAMTPGNVHIPRGQELEIRKAEIRNAITAIQNEFKQIKRDINQGITTFNDAQQRLQDLLINAVNLRNQAGAVSAGIQKRCGITANAIQRFLNPGGQGNLAPVLMVELFPELN